MNLHFYKYEGTGNDFILIDNRSQFFPKENLKLIQFLCNRHKGIGSDGLILIETSEKADFEMIFFNPDGTQSMCGNGSRCAVSFANYLKIIAKKTTFNTYDGLHEAEILPNNIIKLKMKDVSDFLSENPLQVNTGSPHQIQIVDNLEVINIKEKGSEIRYAHSSAGININFVEKISENNFKIRTYERGVENETLSCGTGAIAVALAMHKSQHTDSQNIKIQTLGGELQVSFEIKNTNYTQIFLYGETNFIFEGTIKCPY